MAVIRDGNFVFIYGNENRYKILSTNDCPTILDAVVKGAGGFSNNQIRVVRKDAIIQAPVDKKRNVEEMNAFRQLRINSGDLVISTLMD